jgi:hypothetical protein
MRRHSREFVGPAAGFCLSLLPGSAIVTRWGSWLWRWHVGAVRTAAFPVIDGIDFRYTPGAQDGPFVLPVAVGRVGPDRAVGVRRIAQVRQLAVILANPRRIAGGACADEAVPLVDTNMRFCSRRSVRDLDHGFPVRAILPAAALWYRITLIQIENPRCTDTYDDEIIIRLAAKGKSGCPCAYADKGLITRQISIVT